MKNLPLEVKLELLRKHFHNGMEKKPGQVLRLPSAAAIILIDRKVAKLVK